MFKPSDTVATQGREFHSGFDRICLWNRKHKHVAVPVPKSQSYTVSQLNMFENSIAIEVLIFIAIFKMSIANEVTSLPLSHKNKQG